ncbi:MAG: CoB--CoM heterodisulfide reductase iron-sulfur subunit B family protein [Nitrososphaeria archaeon]
MKLALFLGCTIPTEQYAFEISVRETLPKLGVKLVDIKGASCCGCPLRSVNETGWLYLSARNLAQAEEMELDVLPLCNLCELSFQEVKKLLASRPDLKERINSLLEKEGLYYRGESQVKSLMGVLYDDVGLERIAKSVKRPLNGIKIAAHYGCHTLMPSEYERPDDPWNPHKLEDLIRAVGAETEDYREKLACCGALLVASAEDALARVAWSKLKAVGDRGFDAMALVCPFCHKMFDARQEAFNLAVGRERVTLPVFYYVQLLGWAMGISEKGVGLNLNMSPARTLLRKVRRRGKS